MICIPNCDKIVPGMLMGAVRCNIPTIFISGGPMAAGRTPSGKTIDLISVFQGVGAYQAGNLSDVAAQGARGLRLPRLRLVLGPVHGQQHELPVRGAGHRPARQRHASWPPTRRREELAQAAARQVMTLIDLDLKPLDIITSEAIDNAFALDMAMGGSTNTVLHTIALAHEAGVEYPLERLNELSARVPNLCKVSPSSRLPHGGRAIAPAASAPSCGS